MPTSTYYVNARQLNVRAGPSPTDGWLAVLDRGSVVREVPGQVHRDARWLKVIYQGTREGWVATKYLSQHQPVYEEFPWMPIALAEAGEREVIGAGSNSRILDYLASTTLGRELASQDETPWCSAFVNWCIEHAGYAGTDSAAAVSWRHWGRPAQAPRRGVVAVLSREGGHHVGFWLRKDGSQLYLWGGNQNDQVGERAYDESRLLDLRVAA